MHKKIILEKPDYSDNYGNEYISITYNLNNGSEVQRQYFIPYSFAKAEKTKIVSNEVARQIKKEFYALSDLNGKFESFEISGRLEDDKHYEVYLKKEEAAALINAYVADLESVDSNRLFDEEEIKKVESNPNLPRASRAFVYALVAVLCITICCLITNILIKNQTIAGIIGYLPLASMAILFTIGGIRAGKISGFSNKQLRAVFADGIKTILPCAPIILSIIAITYILKRGMIIDTILFNVYNLISNVKIVATSAYFNFFYKIC